MEKRDKMVAKNLEPKSAIYRDRISGALAVIFYAMFALFSWYIVYGKSMEFYMGEDTGFPDNAQVISPEVMEATLWSAVYVFGLMALYAFLFANPEKAMGCEGELLCRQDLRGRALRKRSHFWTIPWWLQAMLLFAFSYYIRTQVIALIGNDTIQIMDFHRVFYMSLEDGPIFADVQGINFYQAFPNWALHVKLLHLLNVNFGGTPLTGIMFNAIISSLSVVLLYLVLYFATEKDAFAVIAALIFSCWPFYLYYMILLTPDFGFVFFCLLGFLLIVISYRFASSLWLKLILYAAAGVVLSVAGFFKSVDTILIIALFIAGVLGTIAFGKFQRHRMLSTALAVLVFFAAWGGTGKIIYQHIEDYVGGPVNTNVAPYFLNVGMNLETSGQWSEEVLDRYLGLVKETNYDFDTVNTQMKVLLAEKVDTVKAQELWWEFFDVKLQKAWSNNEGIRFVTETINPDNELHGMVFYEKYYPQIQAYQVAVAFLMALGGVAALLFRERRAVLVCALMVFGFGLLLLISEVQPRYKAVAFPFMAAVAAYGLYNVLRLIQLLLLAGVKACLPSRKQTSPGDKEADPSR